MSFPFSSSDFTKLKLFTQLCISNPCLLNISELAFVKSFIEHFGGTVPSTTVDDLLSFKLEGKVEKKRKEAGESESDSDESDLFCDISKPIDPDIAEPQKMGDLSVEPTEEQIAESDTKRSEAVSAFAEKNYSKAIELYTEAIVLNPPAALLYAKRGQIYLLLEKPLACIRDCNRSLKLNPDSATAHKFRGRAYHLLGRWEKAARDLRLACKFDFDEQADEWLREVTPKARKIEEYKREKDRKLQEKLEFLKHEELKKMKEGAEKAKEYSGEDEQTKTAFTEFATDPNVSWGFRDPEINEAFHDMSKNPTHIFKYQSNPKIMGYLNTLISKYGKNLMKGRMPDSPDTCAAGSDVPGAGAGTSSGEQSNSQEPKFPQDDVGLD